MNRSFNSSEGDTDETQLKSFVCPKFVGANSRGALPPHRSIHNAINSIDLEIHVQSTKSQPYNHRRRPAVLLLFHSFFRQYNFHANSNANLLLCFNKIITSCEATKACTSGCQLNFKAELHRPHNSGWGLDRI